MNFDFISTAFRKESLYIVDENQSKYICWGKNLDETMEVSSAFINFGNE